MKVYKSIIKREIKKDVSTAKMADTLPAPEPVQVTKDQQARVNFMRNIVSNARVDQ